MSMTEESKIKVESGGESSDVENGNCSSSGSGGDTKKTCVDCGTSRTPLWRGGPAGPKSLCNACGIKSRKKRQAALGIRQEDSKIKNKTITNSNNSLALDNHRTINKIASVKITRADSATVKNKIKSVPESCNGNKKNLKGGGSRFLDIGFKVPAMKRSRVEKKWREMREEERAAVLLMALSCG